MTAITAPKTIVAGLELPAITVQTLVTLFVAGAVATAAFDLFGQVLAPFTGNSALAPVGLATGAWKVVFGEGYKPGGYLLHLMAGLIAYPAGWMFFWQPLQKRLAPAMPWLVSATLYGVALWVFALFFMAHLFVGLPAFLGWSNITWVALAGHVVFAIAAAGVARWDIRAA